MEIKPPRFANPGVLSPAVCPFPLDHFLEHLPPKAALEAIQQARGNTSRELCREHKSEDSDSP